MWGDGAHRAIEHQPRPARHGSSTYLAWAAAVGAAALIAPSALTLLMVRFGADPREQTKAFAIPTARPPRPVEPPGCSSRP
jgi:hypothetical protein